MTNKRDKVAQCEHDMLVWESEKCTMCGECKQLFSLGEANDDSPAIRLELLAAIQLGGWPGRLPDAWDVGDGIVEFGDSERIPEAWPWNVSRPLAGQFAAPVLGDAVSTFSGIDRTAAASSLQHVAEPRPLSAELIRDAALSIARSQADPGALADLFERETSAAVASWTPPVESSCDALTDRAFPCNCSALREQHSQRVAATSENCKLLGAETCTHDHMTEAETVAQFRVYCGRCGADPCACDEDVRRDAMQAGRSMAVATLTDDEVIAEIASAPAREPAPDAWTADHVGPWHRLQPDGSVIVEEVAAPPVGDGEFTVLAVTEPTGIRFSATDEECDKFGEGLAEPADHVACSEPGCLATIDTLLLLEDATWSIRGSLLFCPAHTVGAA